LKGGQNRQVPIDPVTWEALKKETRASPDRIATAITNSNLLALDSRNLRRVWGKWRRRFACGSYRIHDLRHTCARVIYVKSEHDPFASKQILGHRRIETTFGYLSNGATAKELRVMLPTSAAMEAKEMETVQQTQAKVTKLINIVEQLQKKIERLENGGSDSGRSSKGTAKQG